MRETHDQGGWCVRMETPLAARRMRQTNHKRGHEIACQRHSDTSTAHIGHHKRRRRLCPIDERLARSRELGSRSDARPSAPPTPRPSGSRPGNGHRSTPGHKASHRQPPACRAGARAAPIPRRQRTEISEQMTISRLDTAPSFKAAPNAPSRSQRRSLTRGRWRRCLIHRDRPTSSTPYLDAMELAARGA